MPGLAAAAPSTPLTLRDAAAPSGVLMGAAARAGEVLAGDPLKDSAYAAILASQYGMLSPETALKWSVVHPARDTYNFTYGDELVAFAAAHGMKVRGHTLVWADANPAWLTTLAQGASSATMARILQDHITTVMSHYRGKVFAWDVVNEAVRDGAGSTGTELRDSIWFNQPGIGLSGTGYVEQAFRWAHDADPDALLFYNETGVESPGPKFDAMYNMLKDFVARRVPINGVGLQMHIQLTGEPTGDGLTTNIQRLAALGLQVHVTEMDVRLPVDAEGHATAGALAAEAGRYQEILHACLASPACKAFQTWGFTDRYSWIPDSFSGCGAALPFDAGYEAKPAVNVMINELAGQR
ncbi:MAG TPA: endo-1,4-beta-xylanase [Vicinamibacterales bacterium]|nr:endo-1,4-beta-xylanase [Vicinamibacterales bacterium]